MWRELGYGSNEYQNETTRFQVNSWNRDISDNGNCYANATYHTFLRMRPGLLRASTTK